MFSPEQFRTKAAEYSALVKTARNQNEVREFQELERSFAVLADNEQWLRDNRDKTVHPAGVAAPEQIGPTKGPAADQKSEVTRL